MKYRITTTALIVIAGLGFTLWPTPQPAAAHWQPTTTHGTNVNKTTVPVDNSTTTSTVSTTSHKKPAPTPTPTPVPAGMTGKLIFVSNRTGKYQIFERVYATGALVNLSNNRYNDMNPEVSPDQTSLTFYSDRSGTNQIYKLNLASPSSVTRLTNDGASDYDPSYMPDGRILYKSNYNDGLGDIWIMNGDGSSKRNLTPSMSTTEEWKPAAISNNVIVFTSRSNGATTDELYTLDLTTNVVTRLTNNSVPDWFPSVNATGTQIVFISKPDNSYADSIYLMNPDGSGKTQITTTSKIAADSDDPSWSPDGTHIVFVNSNAGNYDVYQMDAAGNNIQLLEQNAATELSPILIP